MVVPTADRLENALLDAHAAGDGVRLAALYGEAADAFIATGNVDAACFYWTQALVYALEAGLEESARHAERLRKLGRL